LSFVLLKRFCPSTKTKYNKGITFCVYCSSKRAKKAVLQLIDFTTLSLATCTTLGTLSNPLIQQFRSAQDLLYTTNYYVCTKDRIFNINAASSTVFVQLTLSLTFLLYKVNLTLIYKTYSYKSAINKIIDLRTS